jgi:hypothetical protein
VYEGLYLELLPDAWMGNGLCRHPTFGCACWVAHRIAGVRRVQLCHLRYSVGYVNSVSKKCTEMGGALNLQQEFRIEYTGLDGVWSDRSHLTGVNDMGGRRQH